jgi:WD40 repeat protein
LSREADPAPAPLGPPQPRGGDRHLGAREGSAQRLGFSPDGRLLVTDAALGDRVHRPGRGESEVVSLWDIEECGLGTRLSGQEGPVGHAAFSPDGRRVVTASREGTLRVWNAADGSELLRTKARTGAGDGDADDAFFFAFFAAGDRFLVTATESGPLRTFPVDPLAYAREQKLRALTPEEASNYGLDGGDHR